MKKRFAKLTVAIALIAALCCMAATLSACDEEQNHAYEQDTVYVLDPSNINFMGNTELAAIVVDRNILLDPDETYFEFKTDGTVHGQLTTKAGLFGSIGGLLDSLKTFGLDMSLDDINAMIGSVDLADGLKSYAEPMFPGFTQRLIEGDAEGAFQLLENSIGLNIKGLDFAHDPLKAAVKKMGEDYQRTGALKLPSNLLSLIPADAQISITADWQYNIEHVVDSDGIAHEAIYIGGAVAHNAAQTQPFAIFTRAQNSAGEDTLTLVIEFMNITLGLKQKAAA